jgi:outer membrane protein OmpA-like peptidoglycan-associated protein
MNVRSSLFALAMAALAPSPAATAGDLVAPAFWITPGAGIAWPPGELGYGHGGADESELLFGGILGARLGGGIALEARGSLLSTESLNDLKIRHGEGNLTWFLLPESHFVPFVTAGAGVARVKNAGGERDELAWNAGAGALLRFNDQLGVRLDARCVTYRVEDGFGAVAFRPQTEIFAGLNVAIGGAPRDSDRDGIPDRADRCPDTPIGARVDAAGCPIDGDEDGVFDGIDQCRGTPRGATVDALGCPTDSDGDGVFDGIDQCPETMAAVTVDARGCGVDSDGDGVFDGLDLCEGTPRGCTVDVNGCPSDADGDGVCDGVDACATTPADVRVDATGCPIVVTEKETELLETGMIRLENVNFELGKAAIRPESHQALDEVGDILRRWPQLRIEVGGHTDSQGSESFNQKLSEERAQAVLDYLLGKFPDLNAEQLTAVGYGESTPVAPNDTVLNRAKNRRVEFKVLNTEALRRETQKTKFAPRN